MNNALPLLKENGNRIQMLNYHIVALNLLLNEIDLSELFIDIDVKLREWTKLARCIRILTRITVTEQWQMEKASDSVREQQTLRSE